MSHNLETRNNQTSFVAVGEKAWHGLGTYVDSAMTAQQVIEKARLDYIVEKRPIMVEGGNIIPNTFATVRTDTNEALGIVSNSYQIIQNTEAFTFFDSIVDQGEAIFQTAGVLGKGEKIFVTAKLPSEILVHGEPVENYLLLTQGHDGKSSIQVGFTSIRVVCNNTLNAALSKIDNKVSIMHFKNAKEKLAAASKVMGMAHAYQKELDSIFNQMAKVRITDKKLRAYIEKCLKPSAEQISKEEYTKQFTATVDSVMEFAHSHYTQTTEAATGTVWGAYNALSGYFCHLKNYKTQEDKMKSLYFKRSARKIEGAFELAMKLC